MSDETARSPSHDARPVTSPASTPASTPAARRLGIGVTVALALYSITIAVIEWRTSQFHVRSYLGDITTDDGPLPDDVDFYLVNTTLSVFLLWTTALVFLITTQCITPTMENIRYRRFLWSQVVVFVYLGFDDRFQVHEKVAFRVGDIPDDFVVGVVGLVEIGLLVAFARSVGFVGRTRRWLIGAAVATMIMFVIDGYAPDDMRLRLSVEDLAKVWAGWFLVLFAWSFLERELHRARSGP